MKITFATTNPDENTGSYRIWIRDLCRTMSEIDIDSKIVDLRGMTSNHKESLNRIKESDVIILGKCCYRLLGQVKKLNPSAIFGVINVNSDYRDDLIDFVIVGSVEEYTSLRYFSNVFIYPLIEREFENVSSKVHSEKDKIRLCFHGHYPHLSKFDPHLTSALESLSKTNDLTLVIITGHPKFQWQVGKPSGIEIEYHKYDLKTISKIISTCDIGLVPNVVDMNHYVPQLKDIKDIDRGWGETDYLIRFKNKTNAGRSFVFYQHGIPVVHDLSPSSFEIIGSTQEYCVAHDALSWEREIKRLIKDHKERQRISGIYKKTFEEKYNVHMWAKRLFNSIVNISKEKNEPR